MAAHGIRSDRPLRPWWGGKRKGGFWVALRGKLPFAGPMSFGGSAPPFRPFRQLCPFPIADATAWFETTAKHPLHEHDVIAGAVATSEVAATFEL